MSATSIPAESQVVIVTPFFPPSIGGVETHVQEIARGLRSGGCQVEVLTHRFGKDEPAEEYAAGVRVRRYRRILPSRRFPLSFGVWMAVARRRRRMDVLHVHHYHGAAAAGALLAGAGPTVVFTPHFHGGGHSRLAKVLHLLYAPVSRRLIARADRIICVSEAERDELVARYPRAASRALVIPNGVTPPRPAKPWPVADRVALVVSRLEPYKDVERVVRSAAWFPTGWRLVVVGEGSARAGLEDLAARLGAPVDFTGSVDAEDRDRWYATASVAVSMSTREAFGLSVAEGLAAGLPVVASDIAAHRAVASAEDGLNLVDGEASDLELAETIVLAAPTGRQERRPSRTWSWDDAARSTLEAYQHLDIPPAPEPPPLSAVEEAGSQEEGGKAPDGGLIAAAAGVAVGPPLLGVSFAYAAHHQGAAMFILFWAGFLATAVPLAWLAAARQSSILRRTAAVSLLGLWDFAPKFFRNPSGPLFSDEIAHWRQAADVARAGKTDVPNTLIPLIHSFPGMQAVIAGLHQVSGLSLWASGELILALLHACALVGVYALAYKMIGTPRSGGVAAVVWALNPGFMFFDSQFSYESVALPLLVWALVSAVQASDEQLATRVRNGWLGACLALTAACVVTHHLTSYVLAALLLLIAAANSIAPRRWVRPAAARELWVAASFAVGAGLVWLAVAGGQTVSYYSPFLTAGVRQAISIAAHAGGGRQLFGGSTAPPFEKVAAYAAPLLCAALVVWGLWRCGRGIFGLSRSSSILCCTGLAYFLSLPFVLTTLGNEAARRSWTFSYLGLALFAGAVSHHQRVAVRPARGNNSRRWYAVIAATVIGCTLVVGNTSSSLDVEYRFPGPYVYGSDTRSATSELSATTAWFLAHAGRGAHVITDRYTGLSLAGYAAADLAAPSAGFPVWGLFFDGAGAPPRVLEEIAASPYAYLVTDAQMAEHVPAIGVYFGAAEPGAFDHKSPVPAAALHQYDDMTWATEIYRSDNYAIYRMNLSALRAACGENGCK